MVGHTIGTKSVDSRAEAVPSDGPSRAATRDVDPSEVAEGAEEGRAGASAGTRRSSQQHNQPILSARLARCRHLGGCQLGLVRCNELARD